MGRLGDRIGVGSLITTLEEILTTKGDLLHRDASGVVRFPIGADDEIPKVLTDILNYEVDAGGGGALLGLESEVRSFSRLATAGAGTISITGVPFTPKAAIVYTVDNGSNFASWGFVDQTNVDGGIRRAEIAPLKFEIMGANRALDISNGSIATRGDGTLTNDGMDLVITQVGAGLDIDGLVLFLGAGGTSGDISVRVLNSTTQSIPTSSEQPITFDTETFDTDNMHDLVTNTERITIQTAGKYLVTGHAQWTASAAGTFRDLFIRKNASSIEVREKDTGFQNEAQVMAVATVIDAEIGDFLDLRAAQDTGGNLNVQGLSFAAIRIVTGIEGDHAGETVTLNNIQFPAVQVPSADVNNLDDYEEATFTPTLTFETPGDLNVVYSTRVGFYTKIGRQVTIHFTIATSTFTHTTASGNIQITGLPFASANLVGYRTAGPLIHQILNKTGFTQINLDMFTNAAFVSFTASRIGSGFSSVQAGQVTSGNAMNLRGTLTYITD